MIGNDIVDIAEAKKTSNWQRRRFLEKLFTLQEQHYISHTEEPFLMVWRLWSIKEAAYKLYTQLHNSRFYNPKQFECTLNGLTGKVMYKDFECFFNTKITSKYILSEATLNGTETTFEGVVKTLNTAKVQNKMTKEALLKTISKKHNILESELSIIKSEFGIPSVYRDSEQLNIGISISHHGNYGAYAISDPARFQKPCRYDYH